MEDVKAQNSSIKEEITVSVFLLTYNQENFITQTIESILNQKTSFFFEIVIGDDASTDGTSDICSEFRHKFPNIINYKRNDRNVGLMANFISTAKRLKGRYIAICDGDDYWNDFEKLQLQVDFLEENPNCAIVGTQAAVLSKSGNIVSKQSKELQSLTFEQIAKENKIVAPTAMFKNISFISNLPKWFLTLPYGDWPLYLIILHEYRAKACILPQETAVYRLETGESFKMRKDLGKVFYNNARIAQLLSQEPSMKGASHILQQSYLYNKEREMSAKNVNGEFINSFMVFIKIMSVKPSLEVLKTYLFSMKKNLTNK